MCISSGRAERIRGLKNGKGIQYLLNEAYAILGNPILIHDMEYKAIDYNKNAVTDDPLWIEYTTKGTVGHEWLNFFMNECFLEAAANAKRITFLTSEKLKYNRIYGKLFNKNSIQVGCAVMTACDKPFEADDPVLFEEFCAILSTELGQIEFYNDYGQVYLEKLIGELIGGISNKELYIAHLESIYMHLKSTLYLAAAAVPGCDGSYAKLAEYRELLRKTQPEYTYAVHLNHILIILDTDDDAVLNVEKDLEQLNRFFCANNISAGISKPFENLFELNKYYKQALDSLDDGLKAAGKRIFLHN